jgi:hypothetical protein
MLSTSDSPTTSAAVSRMPIPNSSRGLGPGRPRPRRSGGSRPTRACRTHARVGHLLPMLPKPSRPSAGPYRPARLRVLLLVPAARAQVGDVVGDAPVEREHQAEGELGDGDRVLAGAVRHVDAALRRAATSMVLYAGAGADDERQLAGVEHRLGHLRRAHDETPAPTLRTASTSASSLSVGLRRSPRSPPPSARRCRSVRTCRR